MRPSFLPSGSHDAVPTDSSRPRGLVASENAKAQVFAAVEIAAGLDPRPTDDGKAVAKEEVVGAVVVEYFNNGKTGSSVVITSAMDVLKPLFVRSNSAYSFGVTR